MERSTLKNRFFAYINGAAAASLFYLCLSRLLTSHPTSTAQIGLLCYFLVVGSLFGIASASFLLNWPRKLMLQRLAVGSLVPIVIFVVGVRLYFGAAA